jgi:hypothetical protein
VAAAALLAMSGCGDDNAGQLSATAYRDRANAICRALTQANEQALKGIDTGDRSALVKATQEVGRRTTQALDDLDALEGPDASQAGVDRFLARAQEVREANGRRAEALASGDTDKAATAEGDAKRLTDELQSAARDAGLDDCT